ncbi:unnamed protein product [Soboliphyme baturini]|uniref:Serine protease K12H4.7 n=1 Tax=Soboliphyme baturini TaxID=241478 RepID=A0A183IQI6_9BILA|nr:unnamed protein product [Soboliphyme baturini]
MIKTKKVSLKQQTLSQVIRKLGTATFWFKNGRHRDGFLLTEDHLHKARSLSDNVKQRWFMQKLDHFDINEKRMFNQKYYTNSVFYKPDGPMFLMIGGESPARPVLIDESIAELFGALCFYYDFSDISTPNLKWLSSEQALADIAFFIQSMNTAYSIKSPKWITFGGSYPGNLAAWFRMKYPHLAIGAVSSSAPVEAKVNFWEYLKVVVQSLKDYSSKCVENIQQSVRCAVFVTNTTNLFANLFFNFAGVVQYSKDNRVILLPIILKYVSFFFRPTLGRLWTYQTCTEFGYYQTSDLQENNPFSHRFNLNFSLLQCEDIFGSEYEGKLVSESVSQTNIRNGAKDIKVFIYKITVAKMHFIFCACTKYENYEEMQLKILFLGTAHCANMYPANANDPPELVAARKQITSVIAQWLSQSSS